MAIKGKTGKNKRRLMKGERKGKRERQKQRYVKVKKGSGQKQMGFEVAATVCEVEGKDVTPDLGSGLTSTFCISW